MATCTRTIQADRGLEPSPARAVRPSTPIRSPRNSLPTIRAPSRRAPEGPTAAGAVDRYGAALGLPPVYSGANNYWLWGPPPARDTVAVAINVDPALLRRWFRSVRVAAVYRNGLGVSDDEEGAVIYVAPACARRGRRPGPPSATTRSRGPGRALGEALAAGRRVVAGDARQLGQQPGRGQHLEQRLRLPGGGVLGRDDQVEPLVGERERRPGRRRGRPARSPRPRRPGLPPPPTRPAGGPPPRCRSRSGRPDRG